MVEGQPVLLVEAGAWVRHEQALTLTDALDRRTSLALVAQDAEAPYGVGDTIDDHAVEHWINPPAWNQFSDLQGEVIVFKKWGCT